MKALSGANMVRRCDQCEAWVADTESEPRLWGQCRAHAPTVMPCDEDDTGRIFTEAWPRTKTDDWCREFGQKSEERQIEGGEERKLADLVERFSEVMLTKLLAKKRVQGFSGWNDTSDPDLVARLWEQMNNHVGKWRKEPHRLDQLVDVANYCAFIWNLPQERAR